jgi:putative sugar O-methyltransferase
MTVADDVRGRAAAELSGLTEMLEALQHAPEIFRPSRFWEHHNATNLQQIADKGFGAFKRTVNTSYFQWEPGSPRGDGARERVARRLLRLWVEHPDPRILKARLAHPERSLHAGLAARWHAIFVAALWELARRADAQRLLERVQEPELGEPPSVIHRGRLVTEDLAHSALELAAINEAGGLPRAGSLVVELGAGYGRLAWLLLATTPGLRYIVCDIPPALAIAQRYLTELFPDRPAFTFRAFQNPADIGDELASAELIFLLPHQLAALPHLEADLFVNVSSLHEMRPDQIALWFELIDRHTRGRFYTKQWINSVNVFDGLVIARGDYPVPDGWHTLIDRDVLAPPDFFEAVYRARPLPAEP